MHTTSPTQSHPRLTPWMIAIIVVAFVLLTASGCRSGQTQQVAHPTPPTEETAGRVAATTTPSAATPRPSRPDTHTAPRGERASTQVVWTTGAVGEPSTPAPNRAHVTRPVGHDPLDQALDLYRQGASPQAERSAETSAAEPTTATPGGADAPAPLAMFYVFGEAAHTGPYHHTGRNRVLDVVAQVKPTRRANPSKVMLVRPHGDGSREADVYTINVDRMIRAGDLSQNHRLEAGDILYIPPTGAAKLGMGLSSILGLGGERKPDEQ